MSEISPISLWLQFCYCCLRECFMILKIVAKRFNLKFGYKLLRLSETVVFLLLKSEALFVSSFKWYKMIMSYLFIYSLSQRLYKSKYSFFSRYVLLILTVYSIFVRFYHANNRRKVYFVELLKNRQIFLKFTHF